MIRQSGITAVKAQGNKPLEIISGEGDAAHDGYPTPETVDLVEAVAKRRIPMKPRLTVVDKVYFQSPDDDPVEATTAFSQEIESEEQPYSRKKTSKVQGWEMLDTGWIDCATTLLVSLRS